MVMPCLCCGAIIGPSDHECDCLQWAGLEALAERISVLSAEVKARQAALDLCRAALRQRMESPGTQEAGEYIVYWSLHERQSIDSKRLRHERPEVWEAYSSTSQVHTVRVSRNEPPTPRGPSYEVVF